MEKKGATVDAYIKGFPAKVSTRLKAIRKVIRTAAPKAEEKISYNIPAYKLNGVLIYFAAFPRHIGIYPFPSTVKAFQKAAAGYKTGKGSIQFPLDKPLPLPLIRKIVAHAVKENRKKKAKSKAKTY